MANLDLSNLSILVTERHQQMRGIVCDILRQFGVQKVAPATGVSDAFGYFAENGADMIISDWSPEVDALDFIRRVRKDPLSKDFYTPFIVVTAFCDSKRVCLARDSGIHEFLAKPFAAQHLLCRIRTIVEQPRLFIRLGDFFGPDRRRRRMVWNGPERREHANRANTDRRTNNVLVHPERRGLKVVDSRQERRASTAPQDCAA